MSFEHPPHIEPSPDSPQDHFFETLSNQYKQQTQSLHNVGLLEHIPASSEDDVVFEVAEGITGMDGKHYKLPTPEAIKTHFSQEKYKEKLEQGFTRLLIVPFGYPLATIRALYERELLKHHKAGTLLDKDGNKLELDTNQPLFVATEFDKTDETEDLIYYPKQFDQQNHGGFTKQQLLDDPTQPFPGFHILLIKPDLTIPREGQGKIVGTRKDLETNKTSSDYLKTIQTEPQYQQECGFTLEDQFVLAVTNLNQTNTAIDDYAYEGAKPKDSFNFVIGNYYKTSGGVPGSCWYRDGRRADVSRGGPGGCYEVSGARVAVG